MIECPRHGNFLQQLKKILAYLVIGLTVMSAAMLSPDVLADAPGKQGSKRMGQGVAVVKRPSPALRNDHYVSNRAPLKPSPFAKLPVGAVEPRGWLRKQLELQADGMCGHLSEISRFCRVEDNPWLKASSDRKDGYWEEVPYWLKGFGNLGYILDDQRIESETTRWIEALLATRQDDGWFGPLVNLASPRSKTEMEGVNVRGRPDMWPNALMLTVLRSRYEAKQDQRVLELMLGYCRWLERLPEEDYLIHWVAKRRGVEILRNVLWLYNVTGEPWLLDLAHKTHRRTSDWTSGISRYHCVDMSECFYEPALYYLVAGDRTLLDAAERNRRILYDEFGQVPGGMFGGDEMCRPGYVGPRQAVETCAMVEMMNSCETIFTQIDGDVRWADRCEDVAFNSYPAATMPDMTALRYLTAPNHVVSDRLPKNPDINNGGAMYLMSPHLHRCCQHNHAHGWPYYAEHLWLATPDNGLCAMLYCDSSVTARVADGQTVTLDQTTRYPFGERIVIVVHVESPVPFPLYLRLPAWCDNAQLAINHQDVPLQTEGGRYVRIDRTWNDGDRVELVLPATVSLRSWAANGQCVSVDRGPLTYSLAIGEKYVRSEAAGAQGSLIADQEADAHARWPEWEILPTTPWNYGLVLDEDDAATGFQVEQRPWPESDMPWTHEGAPIALTTTARRIDPWRLQRNKLVGAMQRSPVRSDAEDETVTLLPMGACRLRLSAFPTIGSGEAAHNWTTPPLVSGRALEMADGRRIVFSHLHAKETPMAAVDGTLPSHSGDLTVPRATFWPYRGTAESIRLEFAKPRRVHGVEVYWFDDTGRGSCRVPASATLCFFQADQWIPTKPSAAVPVEIDRMNRLEITPVHTKAIELKIQLRQDYSGGVLEVRVIDK